MNQNTNIQYRSASLYVGDLARSVTEAKLFDLFNTIGPVASIRVCRNALTRQSLGYAYVNFYSYDNAEKALVTLNYHKIDGKECRIMWSNRNPIYRQSNKGNIFVKNLHSSINNKSLYDTFCVFGQILSCKISYNKFGQSNGYGYVHYIDTNCALQAINSVNGMIIAGKKVCVELFKPKNERKEEENGLQFTNVYVKFIPNSLTKDKLIKLFENTTNGKITSCKYWVNKFGISACLNFENSNKAKLAIEKLNGQIVDDECKEALYVVRSQKRHERDIKLSKKQRKTYLGTTIYVKNLSNDIGDKELIDMFCQFGEILSGKIMLDKETKRSRGFGFITFKKNENAITAITCMTNQIYNGKRLYVAIAQKKSYRRQFLLNQFQNRQGQYHSGYNSVPMTGIPLPSMPSYQQQPQQPLSSVPIHIQSIPQPRQPSQAIAVSQPARSIPNSISQPPSAPILENHRLTKEMLSNVSKSEQKRLIGERLFPKIQSVIPRLAGKITGMLLELDNNELLNLLNNSNLLMNRINEALAVLKDYQQKRSQSNIASNRNSISNISMQNISQPNCPIEKNL